MRTFSKTSLIMALFFFCIAVFVRDLCAAGSQVAPPKFKVMGERYMNSITILVDKSVTDDQIRALLWQFKNANSSSTFPQIGIPPTTPGGVLDPYATVQIFIFTDPQWTGAENIERATYDLNFGKKWNRQIRGYYFLPIRDEEVGTIGYKVDGIIYTKKYRLVFGKNP